MTDTPLEPPASHIEFYPTGSGDMTLAVRLQDDMAWLTINGMSDLYGTTKQNISLHIKSIYEEIELSPEATVKKYLTVRSEGGRTVSRALAAGGQIWAAAGGQNWSTRCLKRAPSVGAG